jgi:hypothetical protein
MSMKNSYDTIGNRSRDLPACTAMLQPTATQRAQFITGYKQISTRIGHIS